MARTFSGANYLKLTNPTAPSGAAGTVAFRFKPTWNGNDSADHILWEYTTAGTIVPMLSFEKYTDNRIYAGWYTGGADHRLQSLDPPYDSLLLFEAGVERVWILDWDTVVPVTRLYRDGILIAASSSAFTPPATFDTLTVGNRDGGASPAGGNGCEFMRFDYVLSHRQRRDLNTKPVSCISPPPVHHVKILGAASPEPALIGADLPLVGSPTQALHPTLAATCAPLMPAFVKPAPDAALNLAHPLATGLIFALPINEGTPLPVDRVSGFEGIPLPSVATVDVDGALHFDSGEVLAYTNTAFDGLAAITIAMAVTVDVGTFGSSIGFDFPNQPPSAWFAKQAKDPTFPGVTDHQSAFQVGYTHSDEADISSGGRDEIWMTIGGLDGGLYSWYVFRVTKIPWTETQQLFLIYNKNAALGSRVRLWIDGIEEPPVALYVDEAVTAAPSIPTTPSALLVGGAQYLAGTHKGKIHYIYAWEGSRPEIIDDLLDDPFALWRPASDDAAAPIHVGASFCPWQC